MEEFHSTINSHGFWRCITCGALIPCTSRKIYCEKCQDKNNKGKHWTDILLKMAEEWRNRKKYDPYLIIKMRHAALSFLQGEDPEECERFIQRLEKEKAFNESNAK